MEKDDEQHDEQIDEQNVASEDESLDEQTDQVIEDDAQAESNEDDGEIIDDLSETDALKAELEKKTAEAAEYKDKWMRTYADIENLKKRTKAEREDSLKYANFNIINDLLVILDDFERAIEAGKTENFDKDSYVSGIEMIEKQFSDLLFKKYGVVKYGEVGEDFDPNIHQAMMMVQGDYEKEVLANVFRKGYMLHDRVVRPAQVQVGKPADK